MFRNLRADEIECRVGIINEKGVSLLLFKDARADMNILDETVGPLYWKREHISMDGRLYCKVSLYNKELGEWISKTDVGAESFAEKEKSVASDSFKRACVNWGIGRELYSAPMIWIEKEKYKLLDLKQDKGKFKCTNKFVVTNIEYDKLNNISSIVIADKRSKITVFKAEKPKKENKEC